MPDPLYTAAVAEGEALFADESPRFMRQLARAYADIACCLPPPAKVGPVRQPLAAFTPPDFGVTADDFPY